jgi:hypothetical protein
MKSPSTRYEERPARGTLLVWRLESYPLIDMDS